MMNDARAQAYKKEIADYYSRRSHAYDDSAWHDRIARELVECARIGTDAAVLDIATGTGMVAMYAASKLGARGSLVGIDISEGMIDIARSKIPDAPIKNIRFEIGDGEALQFPPESFDVLLCGSAFIWMTDLHSTLTHWKSRLKPKGKVGFHAFSENAFVTGAVAQQILLKYGISYLMNKPTGSVEKCHRLLEQTGFKNIEVIVDQDGSHIGLEEAKKAWAGLRQPAPGQYPHPLASMTAEQMASAQLDYEQELERLNTDRGIWNDMTTFHVFGEKPSIP
ncbi:MAG TPA: methyltransferase domain-containing protein [Mariprofundaceae bacterium]|nr:methyltransferase domain-containing protein [Mariprofundaceae bacterium]